MESPQETSLKIKSLKIQGARAIALASLNTLKNYGRSQAGQPNKIFAELMLSAIKLLQKARPTEPLNYNCLNFLKHKLDLALKPTQTVEQTVNYLLNLLNQGDQKIIASAKKIIRSGQNIFTHCHSATVEKILLQAWQNKKRFQVFNTETRPNFQGRLTAKILRHNGLPVTMVADSAAAFLISRHSGKQLMMNLILLGADALLPDGSAINKIGSFGISLAARENKVPLYIIASLLKYDADGIIPLEIRPTEEIWPHKPKGLKIINFAFDKIPAQYITGIICEFGLIKPNKIKIYVKKHYPWIK